MDLQRIIVELKYRKVSIYRRVDGDFLKIDYKISIWKFLDIKFLSRMERIFVLNMRKRVRPGNSENCNKKGYDQKIR